MTTAPASPLDALVDHIDTTDEMPELSDGGLLGDLARWVANERRKLASGRLGRDDVEHYDRRIPGWSIADGSRGRSSAVTFHRKALSCADHFGEHGSFPTKTSKDAEVARLGEWLRQRRNGSRGVGSVTVSPDRLAVLDRILPGWDTTKSEVWVSRARDLIDFVDEQGRFPRARAERDAERQMYEWLFHFIQAVDTDRRGGAPWQVEYLDGHLPGWRKRHRDIAANWDAQYQQALDYVAMHGSLPTGHLDSPAGARIAAWLYRTARDISPLRKQQWALLDEHFAGWREAKANEAYALTREGRFTDNLAMLSMFVDTHGRLPRGGADATTPEKFLRAWLARQRRTASEARAVRLDAVAPGWRDVYARPNVPLRGGLEGGWLAPRLGDILNVDGQAALVIRPDLNPAAPVTVRVTGATKEIAGGRHEFVHLRTPLTVRLAGAAHGVEAAGDVHDYDIIDAHLAEVVSGT